MFIGEELLEEKDKNERASNIIIHGRKEVADHKEDELFVQQLVSTCGKNVSLLESITRLGRQTEHKKRPIKVTFRSIQAKQEVMKNLRNLKGKEEFKGLNIREDYTIAERNIIKDFVIKARKKNNTEGERSKFVWKVRGNVRSGLFLKRFLLPEFTEAIVETNQENVITATTMDIRTHMKNNNEPNDISLISNIGRPTRFRPAKSLM